VIHRSRLHPFQADHERIRRAVLKAVDARCLVADRLRVTSASLHVGGLDVPLVGRRIWILSVGKAAIPMTQAAVAALGADRIAGGAAVAPEGARGTCEPVSVVPAEHPVPTSVAGAAAIERIVQGVGPEDIVVCLLSGGGSALLAAPPDGVALADLAEITSRLLRSGADIEAINTVRRHVSRLQGGRLLAALHPATIITLILSDVVGGDARSIASGPTVEDPTTFADACDVLRRFGLWERAPESVRGHLLAGVAGEKDETPKPGDPRFAGAQPLLLAGNVTAVEAARREAQRLGFDVSPSGRLLTGEARDEGSYVGEQILRLARSAGRKWAWIGGGETVVTVRGDGLGGRNQELAASAARALEGLPNASLTALATDGRDGPTDAAGALVDGETARRARAAGLDLADALERNDCYRALSSAGDLIFTGLTQTNVADVCWALGGATR